MMRCMTGWGSIARAGLFLATLTTLTTPLVAQEVLTLRVSDAIGVPGGRIAVVLRTYASRPVSQGQICLTVLSPAERAEGTPTSPLAALEEVVVFSTDGDAVTQGALHPQPQSGAEATFTSASASINELDGPMAVFYFRLAAGVTAGEVFTLELDPAATFLTDADGDPVLLQLRPGELEIRSPGSPYTLEAEGDRSRPAGRATLGIETFEPLGLTSGVVALRYPPAIASAPPELYLEPRYGTATTEVDTSTPGLLLLAFESDGTFNQLPGQIFRLSMIVAPGTLPGSYPLTLDETLTALWAADGSPVALELVADELQVEPRETVFADGFESGGPTRWSVVTGL